MYILISAQENYDWNVYKSLQTLALGESHEKELSDERARQKKNIISAKRCYRREATHESAEHVGFSQMCRLIGATLFVCLFGNMRAGGQQEAVASRWI